MENEPVSSWSWHVVSYLTGTKDHTKHFKNIPPEALPAYENDQNYCVLTARSQFLHSKPLQKKGPSTLGMTTLPWLQPQKGQPQLFLTCSSTCQRWLPSGFSLCTPTATGKSACISIFEDCKHFPIQRKTSRTYPSNTTRSPFWRIRKYEGKEC